MGKLEVNLTDFGGKSDDSYFDNRPVLQRAIDFLEKNGGGHLNLGNGTVYFYGNITIPETVSLSGESIYCHTDEYYDTEHEKRNLELNALFDKLLTEYISSKYQHDEYKWGVDDIYEMSSEIEGWKNKINDLLGT